MIASAPTPPPTRPPQERDAAITRFENNSPVMSHFPITLCNGNTVSILNGGCVECKKVVPDECLRGSVSKLGEPDSPKVISFDAIALCTDCNLLSPVFGRIRAVGKSMQMETIRNGLWVGGLMTRESWWVRTRAALYSLLGMR